MSVVRTKDLRKNYEAEGAPVRALRGVDVEIKEGEFVAVMGPSGCGKSTLLNLIAGLDTPTDGEISVADESLVGKDENQLAKMRRKHIGIVFQFFNLLEGMSVLENVTLPAMTAGSRRRRGHAICWTCSGSRTRRRTRPACSPVVSVSGWRSRGRWRTSRRSCSPTSRPARWTPREASR